MSKVGKLLKRLSRLNPFGVRRTKAERAAKIERATKFDDILNFDTPDKLSPKANEMYLANLKDYNKSIRTVYDSESNLRLEDGNDFLLETGFKLLLEG